MRENRKLFLHKGAFHRFKGYAYSQLHKMRTKDPQENSKRADAIHGNCKFAYHVVRLLDEAEQILEHGDIDLQRAREHLKEIRRGEIPEPEIRRWASEKEAQLEKLYGESKLQHSPDEQAIKQLLLDCLEHHYGNLSKCVATPDSVQQVMLDLQEKLAEAQKLADRLKLGLQ